MKLLSSADKKLIREANIVGYSPSSADICELCRCEVNLSCIPSCFCRASSDSKLCWPDVPFDEPFAPSQYAEFAHHGENPDDVAPSYNCSQSASSGSVVERAHASSDEFGVLHVKPYDSDANEASSVPDRYLDLVSPTHGNLEIEGSFQR